MDNNKTIAQIISDSINFASKITIDHSRKEYFRHTLTGKIGIFVEKRNGYYGEMMIIKLGDGREYFAPVNEFTKI